MRSRAESSSNQMSVNWVDDSTREKKGQKVFVFAAIFPKNLVAIVTSIEGCTTQRQNHKRVMSSEDASQPEVPQPPVKNTIESTKRLQRLINKYVANKLDILQIDYLDMGISKSLRMVPMDLLAPLTNMKQIFINGHKNLREIPPAMFTTFRELKEGWFHDNDVKTIPPEIGQAKNLTEIWFQKNRITSIPVELFSLVNLKELRLDDNQLTSIPSEIGQLVHLEVLRLDYNEITKIPVQIGDCEKLIHLSISHNKLESIPAEIGYLTQLKSLTLSNNCIYELPNDVVLCQKLEELCIDRNQIAYIPLEMVQLSDTLKVFKLYSNPIINLPEKLIGQKESIKASMSASLKGQLATGFAPDKIFGYLSDLGKGQEVNNRIKLMVMGQESTGKTTLLSSIKGKIKFPKILQKAPAVTEGINIVEFSTTATREPKKDSKEKEKPVKIDWSAWDFDGQEAYYSSHQFFLSSRAIYVIVWNLENTLDQSKLEYWLQSIKARAPKAPIIIVGTHSDSPVCTSDYLQKTQQRINEEYYARFPNIQYVCEVDAKKGKNIEELIKILSKIALAQPRMGENIPKSYLLLEEKVLKERKRRLKGKPGYPLMTYNEYSELALGCSISEDALPRATEFLYEVGVVIHFNDPNRGLSNVVFLDPRFLVDLMSTVSSTKANFVRNGTVRWKHMQMLWKKYPTELHPQLLALLEKFEIAIRLNKSMDDKEEHPETIILFPSFLDEAQVQEMMPKPFLEASVAPSNLSQITESSMSLSSAFDLAATKKSTSFNVKSMFYAAVERVYQMAFLPEGLFSRLIVRLVALKRSQLNWNIEYSKNTIFLARNTEWAFIQLQHIERQIKTFVAGGDPTRLLRVVTENLETLMEDWFPNLNFNLLVTCSHCLKLRLKEKCMKKEAATYESIDALVFAMVREDSTKSEAILNSSQFTGREIEEAIGKGNYFVMCNEKRDDKSNLRLDRSTSFLSEQGGKQGPAAMAQEATSLTPQDRSVEEGLNTDKKSARKSLPLSEIKTIRPLSTSLLSTPNLSVPQKSPSTTQKSEPISKTTPEVYDKISDNISQLAKSPAPIGINSQSLLLKIIEPISYETVKNEEGVQCHKIPLPEVVPDLCLSFLDNVIPLESITLEKELGKGSYAVVYKAVAVKQYKLGGEEGEDDTNYGGSKSVKSTASSNRSKARTKVLPVLSSGRSHKRKATAPSNSDNDTRGSSLNSRALSSWGTQMAQDSPYHEFRREAALLSEIDHPNIMKFVGIIMSPLGVVTEFLNGGDLKGFIMSLPDIDRPLRISLALDMAKGINYLHQLAPPIIHRDLKSPNCLVAKNADGTVTAKLGDLGLSRRSTTGMVSRKVDNPRWLAPEIMENKPYDEKSDVYSFGIMLWELVERGNPFEEFNIRFMMQLEEKIRGGLRPTLREGIRDSAYGKLFDDCVQGNPAMRPSFVVILETLNKMMSVNDEKVPPPEPKEEEAPLTDGEDEDALPLSSDDEEETEELLKLASEVSEKPEQLRLTVSPESSLFRGIFAVHGAEFIFHRGLPQDQSIEPAGSE
ncbi:hypothetical protein PROFUN_05594 [Planoprotostelium fungivorum]|uniref:non-specific serine/threonine protein kinase n=1 Tax=Planoprotostelium fungivorum TaxID=1890364 RepID=A0A2P6N067_9EUKA|nr:hypothetical protein PROFUN_05594 [Planoprotostelium fungivorum]